jgi:hypothetical protein
MQFELTRTIEIPSIKSNRLIKITDLVFIANALKLAVATTNRDLCFFDVADGKLCHRVHGLEDIITSMDYAPDEADLDKGSLVCGDLGGFAGRVALLAGVPTFTLTSVPCAQIHQCHFVSVRHHAVVQRPVLVLGRPHQHRPQSH